MTKDDIENLKSAWVAAVRRSVKIGFDVIEIHNAQYVEFSLDWQSCSEHMP